ncbi:MAG: SOS response-associated peptidase [Rhodobacteraceae bacterium]|nr:SOS response-associated peptidase [Paracoccaceae bacterium]
MCSRYELNTPPERMIERFGLRVPETVTRQWSAHKFAFDEIRPTNIAPIVLQERRLEAIPWGLAVSWQSQPLIHARAETLDSKPTFKPLLQNRCVVPASAYFEWRRDGKAKIKTRIASDDQDLFAFAGLTDGERFTIVTCEPAASIAHIHHRMPVILGEDATTAWLDRARSYAEVKPLLVPFNGKLAWTEPQASDTGRQPRLFG